MEILKRGDMGPLWQYAKCYTCGAIMRYAPGEVMGRLDETKLPAMVPIVRTLCPECNGVVTLYCQDEPEGMEIIKELNGG